MGGVGLDREEGAAALSRVGGGGVSRGKGGPVSLAKRLRGSGYKGPQPCEVWRRSGEGSEGGRSPSDAQTSSGVQWPDARSRVPLPGQTSFLEALDGVAAPSIPSTTFYLGTHMANWLGKVDVPLFISRRRLAGRKRLPRALGPWALDSGGFTELGLYGGWRTEPARYADEVLEYAERIGSLEFAAVQDWMCEPFMLAKTGRTVREHQELSIESYLTLRAYAPSIPWLPVVQGWSIDDYLAHVERFAEAGVDLRSERRVGVGSVCRRQGTREALTLFCLLQSVGLRLHGFGIKTRFMRVAPRGVLESCDSLAWSSKARRSPPLPGCRHRSCANCLRYALAWRRRVLDAQRGEKQQLLFMRREAVG